MFRSPIVKLLNRSDNKIRNQNMIYTIVAPGTIRPNSNYHVSVNLHESKKPLKVKVGIESKSFNEFKTVEVEPLSTQLVSFEIPKLEDGDYNLVAEGLSELKFKNTTKLNFDSREYIILVQTDKATYKPGDLVRFRVLFLDKNTRPVESVKPINIVIDDPQKNRIKQLNKVELNKGVFSGELQLAPFPNLGTWNIDVEMEGTKESKSFEVEKYVLPKFEVTIDSNKHFAKKDGKVSAIVRAKYTYGKPVKGEATVAIEPKWRYWSYRDSNNDKEYIVKKVLPLDGKATVVFDIENDLKFDGHENTYVITANVEEKLTGVVQNGTTDVTVHKDRYKIEGVNIPYSYKDNEPVEITVVVKNYDESPVRDTKNPVQITVKEPERYYPGLPRSDLEKSEDSSSEPKETTQEPKRKEFKAEANLDENGMATVKITIPPREKEGYSSYSINAKYLDVESYIGQIRKEQKDEINEKDLTVKVGVEKATLQEEIPVQISSKHDLKYFFYQVVARGDIIDSGFIKVPEGKKSYTLNIKPSLEMVPSAAIFVYFSMDKKLIYKDATIDFEENLQNFVKLNAPLQVKPGEKVDIKISSKPDSLVGLLGVDQSVLLLRKGNDITKDNVFSKIKEFSSSAPWNLDDNYYTPNPGRESGLITYTNADLQEFREKTRMRHKIKPVMASPMLYAAPPGKANRLPRAQSEKVAPKRPPPKIKIRKEFPETWVWDISKVENENGETTISQKIPDTITSWVLTGFSLNSKDGIGLTKSPRTIEVFQPFFVSTNLPYSVKRGEVIAIPAIVFNYQDTDADVEIIFDNTDQDLEFIDPSNEIDETGSADVKRSIRATVEKNSGLSKSFLVRPKKVGYIPLKLSAVSPTAGDAIKKMLLVEPEGVTEYVNKAFLLNLKENAEDNKEIKIEVPEDAVPDSTYVEISVVGDILGPTVKNLDKLVRKPYGCGEQNMVNFVPNILVLQYLEKIGQLTPAIESKAKNFLEVGYQRELTYKHDDGSYSAFGKSDKSGSTWLTAYVAKSFSEASKYIQIDDKIIKEALEFLVKKQASNGSFVEAGRVIDHSFPSNSYSLTSYVLLALLECQQKFPKYTGSIKKGLDYLAKNLNDKVGIFDYAIVTLALQKGQHEKRNEALEKLKSLSKQEGDKQWWTKGEEEKKDNTYYWHPRNEDVELTSYGILSLLESGAGEEVLPIVKWLISQRNSEGGFDSTQDTVVGLAALIKFAEKFSPSQNSKIEINFSDDLGNKGQIISNKENSLVLQTHILNPPPKVINVNSKGSGSSLIQVSYKYNINKGEETPRFAIKSEVQKTSTGGNLDLSVCTSFIPQGDEKVSNMAVMEVSLPSGFVADSDNLEIIRAVEGVKRVETKNDETVVVMYFDNLDEKEICPVIRGYKAHRVAKQKPVSIIVYDYYDNSRQARVFYNAPEVSLNDICEGDDCKSEK